ncbi:MAG: fasciclin domain-containing protein [Ferruginibacter sp.]
MKYFAKGITTGFLLIFGAVVILSSCNKDVEQFSDPVPVTSPTLADIINTDANYSILKNALTRTGIISMLATKGGTYTVFAPDNNAFIASGLSDATVTAMPIATLTGLMQYHVITENIPAASIPAKFPNLQMPTLIQLPGGNPLVRMNIFPAKNGGNYFVNNMPIAQTNAITATNGVMHRVPFVVQPPSLVLAQMIYADPNFTYLTAAIARADSGQTGLNKLDSVLKFGAANVTVFAPTNAAFQATLTALITQALIAQGVPPATAAAQAAALASSPTVFSNPALYAAMPAATVRGIVAYHLLGSRAFSVNLPLTTSTIQTLIGPAPYPQLTVDRSTASPRLTGPGNLGTYANFTAIDRMAVNGVWHVIDKVLLPQ